MSNDVWDQDISNIYLSYRDICTYGLRPKFVYSQHVFEPPTTTNTKSVQPDLRNVDLESRLQWRDNHDRRDTITLSEAQKLQQGSYSSNQQLYRMYHAHEIHSPCYPNLDRSAWNNTTKEIYNTADHRSRTLKRPK